MVLKGGTLQFISQNQDTIEEKLIEILQDQDTTIILVSCNQQLETDNGIGILAFVLQITFAEKFKAAFDRSGLPLYNTVPSDKVIILKFFVYNHNPISGQIVDNEVETQRLLDLKTVSQQICPSVLYVKDIEETIQEGTIDHAIYSFLRRKKAIIKVSSARGIVTNEEQYMYMYDYILSISLRFFSSTAPFDSLKKKAFFMEFFSCKSLLNFCDIPQYFDEGKSVTSIDGITLTIDHIPNTPQYVLGLDKDSFKKMALHYVTLKLFKFNCIHGDLHASNVYVLLDGTNIVFLVIDFGNGKIGDDLQLKLYEIPHIIGYKDYTLEHQREAKAWLYGQLFRKHCFRKKEHAIYLLAIYVHLIIFPDATADMYKYIKTLIDNKTTITDMFKVAIIINMCVENNSLFPSTFSSHIEVGESAYAPLYCSYKDLKTQGMCNQIIEQCLYPITERELLPKRAKTTGGGSFYKNRINKFIVSKQINRKSKKRKNKTRNTKKSRKITMKKRIAKTKK